MQCLGLRERLFHGGIKVTGKSGIANFFFMKMYYFSLLFEKYRTNITPKKKKKSNRVFALWCHLNTVLQPESSLFFLSYLNLVIPAMFE